MGLYNKIQNSNIIDNIAIGFGGAINSIQSDFSLENVIIRDNEALIGGGIRCIEFIPISVQQYIKNKYINTVRILEEIDFTVEDNVSIIHGDDIGLKAYEIGIIGSNHQIQNKNSIMNVASGQEFSLNVSLKDISGEIIQCSQIDNYFGLDNTINDELQDLKQIHIVQLDQTYEIQGQTQYECQENNWFTISQTTIYKSIYDQIRFGIYNKNIQSINLYTMSFQNDSLGNQLSIEIFVYFRRCIIGEIIVQYGNGYHCQECPQGKYSLVDPYTNDVDLKCQVCPKEGYDCYKDVINLRNTYWRKQGSQNQEAIVPCSNTPQYCQAESIDTKFYCTEGHVGPVCEECDTTGEVWGEKYRRDGITYRCWKCSEQFSFLNLFYNFFILGTEIWFIQFSVKNSVKNGTLLSFGKYLRVMSIASVGNQAYKDKSSFFIKQFFHYMALAKFSNSITFRYSEYVKFLPTLFSSPIQIFYYIFDCIFSEYITNGQDLLFLRGIWTLFIPFAYGLVLLILYSIYTLFSRNKFNKYYIFNGGVFFLVYMQPGMLSQILKTVNCRYIGEELYNAADLTFDCQGDNQKKFALVFGYNTIIIWSLVLPVLLFRRIKYTFNNNRQQWYTYRIKTGFLSSDVRRQFYFQEFIRMYKKILIVLFYSIFSSQTISKLVVSFLLVFVYYSVVQTTKPYKFKKIANIDKYTMWVIMLILSLNILVTSTEILWMEDCGILATIFIYWGYFVYLIYNILDNKVQAIYPKQYIAVQQYFIKKYPFLKNHIKEKKLDSVQCYLNWRKAYVGIFKFVRRGKVKPDEIVQAEISSKFNEGEKFFNNIKSDYSSLLLKQSQKNNNSKSYQSKFIIDNQSQSELRQQDSFDTYQEGLSSERMFRNYNSSQDLKKYSGVFENQKSSRDLQLDELTISFQSPRYNNPVSSNNLTPLDNFSLNDQFEFSDISSIQQINSPFNNGEKPRIRNRKQRNFSSFPIEDNSQEFSQEKKRKLTKSGFSNVVSLRKVRSQNLSNSKTLIQGNIFSHLQQKNKQENNQRNKKNIFQRKFNI